MFQLKRANLFIIGAQKGMTTSVHQMLCQHKDIDRFKPKELHFFDLQYVHNLPIKHSIKKYLIDASPSYCLKESNIKRIMKFNPNSKIIYIFRDPIDRIISQYNMEFNRGIERRDALIFENHINIELENRENIVFKKNAMNYIWRSMYTEHVAFINKIVPIRNICYLNTEDLKNNKYERISNFLSLDLTGLTLPLENKSERKLFTNFSKVTKENLDIFFKPEYGLISATRHQ